MKVGIADIVRILQNTINFSNTPNELAIGKNFLCARTGFYDISIEINIEANAEREVSVLNEKFNDI